MNSIRLLECVANSSGLLQARKKYVIKYNEIIQFNTIRFSSLFIYVMSSTANGQLQSQHEYKPHQQYDNTGEKHNKNRENISV
jgi:hypothetical protein